MKAYIFPLLVKNRLLGNDHRRLAEIRWKLLRFNRTIFSETGIWNEDLTEKRKHDIEKYWKKRLQDEYKSEQNKNGEKMYVLSMFPYPSGKLHMGHVRVYTISDVLARYHRMLGKQVIHPIGWDSFGLPAENAARERNEEPRKWTYTNIAQMKEQLKQLNCSFDWERELATSDPSYYKWTQYIFLKMFDAGIAYQKLALVNWDPVDNTVLANEQIDENGRSWRSGAVVEKKLLKQWFIKTTKFSKNLYEGLNDPNLRDWEEIETLQREWIGKCNGWNFDFPLELDGEKVDDWLIMWTSSPELIFGVTFIAVTPDHYLSVSEKSKESSNVDNFVEILLKHKAINPFTNERLPIIVTNNISYPQGANSRLGIPANSIEDIEVCKRFNLSSIDILDSDKEIPQLKNSGQFSGMTKEEARKKICAHAKKVGFGGYASSARLQDWLISRQRYWGTPIPIIHCPNCKVVPVPYSDLPVVLPDFQKFSSTDTSPLKQMTDWLNVRCPKCGTDSKRETDTMDTFVDSSWYFLRYLDPHNDEKPFCPDLSKKFIPVDLYIGGKEHALLHLYLARYVSHFLHSEGLVHCQEPFQQLVTVGMIKGQTYVDEKTGQYFSKEQVYTKGKKIFHRETNQPISVVWKKMSKSKYNGVDPEDIFKEYGVDATRLVLLFAGKPNILHNWSTKDFVVISKWKNRLWFLVSEYFHSKCENMDPKLIELHNKEIYETKNYVIKTVTNCLNSAFRDKTGIHELVKLTNDLRKLPREIVGNSLEYEEALEALIVMLAPFAPYFASELWAGFASSAKLSYQRDKSVWKQAWPEICMNYEMKINIQLNNKNLTSINIPRHSLEKLNKTEIIKIAEKAAAHELEQSKCLEIHCEQNYGHDAQVNFIVENAKEKLSDDLKKKSSQKAEI